MLNKDAEDLKINLDGVVELLLRGLGLVLGLFYRMIIPKNETLSDAFFGLSNLFHWPTPLLTEVMVCPMLFNIFCTSSTDGLT